jgi:hypothetical protein
MVGSASREGQRHKHRVYTGEGGAGGETVDVSLPGSKGHKANLQHGQSTVLPARLCACMSVHFTASVLPCPYCNVKKRKLGAKKSKGAASSPDCVEKTCDFATRQQQNQFLMTHLAHWPGYVDDESKFLLST